jgi:hypothetical protein
MRHPSHKERSVGSDRRRAGSGFPRVPAWHSNDLQSR